MTKALNPKYLVISNHLVPAWYNIEKENIKSDVGKVSKVAITSDGWTTICQDHYITVTAHYISEGRVNQKVLKTKSVYKAQTGGHFG